MRNDFTLRLEPSKIAGLTLDASSALNLNPKYTKAQQFKATVDTTDGWMQRRKYVPFRGEIIVYSDRNVIDGMDYPGIKIGDGMAYVVDLPRQPQNETPHWSSSHRLTSCSMTLTETTRPSHL